MQRAAADVRTAAAEGKTDGNTASSGGKLLATAQTEKRTAAAGECPAGGKTTAAEKRRRGRQIVGDGAGGIDDGCGGGENHIRFSGRQIEATTQAELTEAAAAEG